MVSSDLRWVRRSETLGRFLCVFIVVDGVSVLAGWLLDRPVLTAFVPGGEPGRPESALALIASALACTLLQPSDTPDRHSRWARTLGASLCAFVFLVGSISLIEIASGRRLDSLAVHRSLTAGLGTLALPMSAAAALTFIVLGVALPWLAARRSVWPVHVAAHAVLFSGVVPLAGYLYDSAAFRAAPALGTTALPTALGFVAMSGALMMARPAHGVMRTFTSASGAGAFARRAVVSIVIAPVVINWIEVAGELVGWYPQRVGWMLDTGVTVTLLLGLTWWVASALQVRDAERQSLTDALRESEQRYRTLVDSAPDAVVLKNQRRIEFANSAALQLVGAERIGDVVGRSPFAFVHAEERAAVESHLCALLENRDRTAPFEHRVVRLDGTPVHVETAISAVEVGGERLAQVILRDVSKRKDDEQALRESEERLRLIAETITEVFWMADVDIGTMVYVSPAYERVWGRTCESLYQNPQSFLQPLHPDDRDRVLDDLKVKTEHHSFDHEYRVVQPNGAIRWVWDRGFPVRGADGRVRHYVGVAQDITDRKERERQLHESVERFELVARATNDAVWDFNVQTGDAWWSDAWFDKYGFTRGTMPTLEVWASHIHPDERAGLIESFNRLLQGPDEQWTKEYRYRRADGSYANVIDRARVVRDASGAPVRVAGVLEDVTERLRLQMQLHQAAKMEAIGQLAGGVAHDFNNLLTVIHGQASFIAETGDIPAKTKASADAVIYAAERAAALTRQLLLFSRQQAVQRSHFDVNDTITGMGRMLRRILGEDVHLKFELAQRPLFVDADASMIDQVVFNLAVNARDAMPNGGVLVLSTSERSFSHEAVPRHTDAAPGRYVCISVSDTGQGIPARTLPHIFEPFFSTKDKGKGTGLGLATVHGIVEEHRGWIDVESEPGEGTTFHVWLPLSDVAEPLPAGNASVSSGRGSETILLVEDDEGVLVLMRAALERNGYNVLSASNASDARELWRANIEAIHLLLTDIVLPLGTSGRELAAQLRAERPTLKVLFVSGYSVDFAGKHIALGVGEHFLQKPFTPNHLVESVRACFDG